MLEARARLLGKEHPHTLAAMSNLAGTLYAQRDLAGGRKLQEPVLEARARLLGKEYPDTLRAMNDLTQTLEAQGDLTGAKQASGAPSPQPPGADRAGTAGFRMMSNFWRLCDGFFRGSARFRRKKTSK